MSPDTAIQVERLLEVGRLAHARKLLGEVFQKDPADVEAKVLAARLELDDKDVSTARRFIDEALTASPNHRAGRVVRFRVLLEAKELGAAEETILGLLRDEPSSAPYLALYAWLMLHAWHLDKARALVGEALRISPEHTLAQVIAVLLDLVDGKGRGAADKLPALVAADPQSEHVAWLLISVLASRGRNAAALEVAQVLLRSTPDDKELIETLVDLKVATHPTTWPLRPLMRGGWVGVGVMWFLAVTTLSIVARVLPPSIAGAIAGAYLVFLVYSWLYPPFLKRWFQRHGF